MADPIERRQFLKLAATAAAVGAAASGVEAAPLVQQGEVASHERRMAWWRAAKFGMFVTWGPPALYQRGDWVTGIEDVPAGDYANACARFTPPQGVARNWARLARQAGMKYMVLVTKHHDGYCLFDSKLTDFCATKLGSSRDLVREYVEAARAEGLKVGLYYSLMDWHHPDGMRSQHDAAARERFVGYTHGQIRELMTNYGKVDILWYDVAVPLDAAGWRSAQMNAMVYALQPDIVINNRNWLPGDFATPEQQISAATGDWECCMTLNENWNLTAGDDTWKSPRQIIYNLTKCVQDGGNYIVNIGPAADGSIPAESVETLRAVGHWLAQNGDAIYGATRSRVRWSKTETFTRRDNILYIHNIFPAQSTLTIGGIRTAPRKALLLASGAPVRFEQTGSQLRFLDIPAREGEVFTIAAEFETFPEQNSVASRAAARLHELYTETGISY